MLKPRARLAIYTKFLREESFPEVGDQLLADFEKFLLKQWAAVTLNDLEADLGGTKISGKFIRHALTGQDVAANPIAHLALLSALWTQYKSKPKPEECALELPSRPLQLGDDIISALHLLGFSKSDFMSVLLQAATQERLPIDICINVVENIALDELTAKTGLGLERLYRLRIVIDEFLRRLAPGKEVSLSGLKRQARVLSIREKHRATILATADSVIISTGTLEQTTAYKWCVKHDKQWLHKIRVEVKTKYFRHRVLCRKTQGQYSQERVWLEDPAAFCWLVLHDREWFINNLSDEDRKTPRPETRARYRKSVMTAIQKGSRKLPSGAKLWCLRNDLEWFQAVVPSAKKRREAADLFIPADEIFNVEEIREKCRDIIRKAIVSGRARDGLPLHAKTWALHFDKEWLDQIRCGLPRFT
jgi:hypothetical protein